MRIQQNAIINKQIIDFDFMAGDVIQTSDGVRGIILRIENPYAIIDWMNDDIKARRGSRLLINQIEHAQ